GDAHVGVVGEDRPGGGAGTGDVIAGAGSHGREDGLIVFRGGVGGGVDGHFGGGAARGERDGAGSRGEAGRPGLGVVGGRPPEGGGAADGEVDGQGGAGDADPGERVHQVRRAIFRHGRGRDGHAHVGVVVEDRPGGGADAAGPVGRVPRSVVTHPGGYRQDHRFVRLDGGVGGRVNRHHGGRAAGRERGRAGRGGKGRRPGLGVVRVERGRPADRE